MKKKLALILLFIGFATSAVLPLQKVFAAVAGQWVDSNTITIGSETFVSLPPPNNFGDYYKDGYHDESLCSDLVTSVSDDRRTAQLQRRVHPLNTNPLGGGGLPRPDGGNCTVASQEQVNFASTTNAPPAGSFASRSSSGSTSTTSTSNTCESRRTALAWIFCPVIKLLDVTMNFVDTQIQAMLDIDTNRYVNDDIKKSWATIRNIAYIILIPITLVMVIGTAIGSSMIDAYTVKKAMPRLAIAVIFIALSYEICSFLISLFNTVGYGTLGLMTAPFGDEVANLTLASLYGTDGGVLEAIMFLPKILLLGPAVLLLLWFFGTTFLLFVGAAFIVLMMRQLFVVGLVLLAPLAILAWIFPGNDKLWKSWWGMFSKLLIMFPLIMGIIAVGRIFAFIINTERGGGLEGGLIAPFTKLAAYMLPYAFIPFTFKFAGGIFANIAGVVNDKEKGLFDRQRKKRAEKLDNMRKENVFKGAPEDSFRGGLNRLAGGAMHIKSAGLRPGKMRGNMRAARSARISALSAEADKSAAVRQVAGNDDLIAASLHGNGTEADARQYLEGLGQGGAVLEQNVASIMQAKKDMGTAAFEDFAAANLAGTGTGYGSGPAEMLETINRVAGSDRARAARILVAARGQAEKARRSDLYGAGMATSADQMEQLYTGATNGAAVNEVMTDESLATKSAGEIGTSRNGALVNMEGAVVRRLARAQAGVAAARATGNQTAIDNASHELKRVLAHTSSFLDVAGSSSPENAQIVGALMGQDSGIVIPDSTRDVYRDEPVLDLAGNPAIDTTTNLPVTRRVLVASGVRRASVGEAIEHFESDREYKQYKKTYTNERSAAAAAAGGGAGAGGAGTGGAGGGGAGGPYSDLRLKQNINQLYTTSGNIRVYTFEYIWGGPTYVGVIAQEILDTHPEAVGIDSSGYYFVDYDVLGLKMVTLEDWQTTNEHLAKSKENIRV
jgi:hypothetical protein